MLRVKIEHSNLQRLKDLQTIRTYLKINILSFYHISKSKKKFTHIITTLISHVKDRTKVTFFHSTLDDDRGERLGDLVGC